MTNEVVITEALQCSVEVVPTVTSNVVLNPQGEFAVQVVTQNPVVVQFGLTNIGLRGPQGEVGPVGPSGPNTIGGYPIDINNAQENDLLQLKAWSWKNAPQEALTDGGNF